MGTDGKPRLNLDGIGNEVCNAGPAEPFTPSQYATLSTVISQIRRIYPQIGPQHVLGHNEITNRKNDPGVILIGNNWRPKATPCGPAPPHPTPPHPTPPHPTPPERA